MSDKKIKNIFIPGAITPDFIGNSIAKHSVKKNIGAHSIFLGQVRNDRIDGREVTAIEYTAYEEMANGILHQIRENIFARYALTCMHVYHSLGRVMSGEISLFVFTSSAHRSDAIKACEEMVELIKKDIPVWGRELFDDDTHVWKQNAV